MTTRFSQAITQGLATADDKECAVCLVPGTELAFDAPLRGNANRFVPFFMKKFDFKTGKFVQLNVDNPYQHHDAIEFGDGGTVLINDLVEDQMLRVIQLPAPPQTAKEVKEQERAATV